MQYALKKEKKDVPLILDTAWFPWVVEESYKISTWI